MAAIVECVGALQQTFPFNGLLVVYLSR